MARLAILLAVLAAVAAVAGVALTAGPTWSLFPAAAAFGYGAYVASLADGRRAGSAPEPSDVRHPAGPRIVAPTTLTTSRNAAP